MRATAIDTTSNNQSLITNYVIKFHEGHQRRLDYFRQRCLEEEIRRLRMVEYEISPSLLAFGFNIYLVSSFITSLQQFSE